MEEGFGRIGRVDTPETANPGDGVPIVIDVKNDSQYGDEIWCRIIDADSGEEVGLRQSEERRPNGYWLPFGWILTMPEKTWNLVAQAGHDEDGTDVMDTEQNFTINLPYTPPVQAGIGFLTIFTLIPTAIYYLYKHFKR